MELTDLLTALRITLDDEIEPFLWSDETLTGYLNNAVREACLRARLLKSDADNTPALCAVAVVAGTATYAFDPSILVVRSAIFEGGGYKLYPRSALDMDRLYPGWDNGDPPTGTPCEMVMDLEQKSFQLYPTPDADATLRLRVWRVPVDAEIMAEDDDEPAIALADPEELKHWAAYEAYLKKDGEAYDPERADAHLSTFESRFGKRPTLHDMARWADTPPRDNLRAHFL
jgi:hypothetical protein